MTEKKWRANADKVAFAKQFSGRLIDWRSAVGKKIERIVPPEGPAAGMVIFSDGAFIFIPSSDPEPAALIQTIMAARPFLEKFHQDAYEGLDRRIAEDQELQRMARLENILGAIRNNLPQIPELKEALRRFLEEEG